MLELTRTMGEAIIIGKDIKIIVLSDRQGQVGPSIEAPIEVRSWIVV